MNPRVKYEMSQAQLDAILDACKPTPVIKIGSYTGSTPQDNANRAWGRLGEEMGFDAMTVRPDGDNPRFFTAVPTETEPQRLARESKEREEHLKLRIETLKQDIADRQKELSELLKP